MWVKFGKVQVSQVPNANLLPGLCQVAQAKV